MSKSTTKTKKTKKETTEMTTPRVAISKIFVPENVRDEGWESKIGTLAKSIAASGLEQPIKVIPYQGDNGQQFELVHGFRRLEACKSLKWTMVPVVFGGSKMTEKDKYISRLTENDEREDLTPLEEARALQKGIEEHKFTVRELARRRGKTEGHISQRLALLRLPEAVKDAIETGELKPTHARAMLQVKDEAEQVKLLDDAKKMSVQEFQEKVNSLGPDKAEKSTRGRKAKEKPATDNDKGASKAASPVESHDRTMEEVKEALAKLDEKKVKAKAAEDAAKEAYIKGMMRGVAWVKGLAKTLW
jgi:ParB family chromosome partitioning protein